MSSFHRSMMGTGQAELPLTVSLRAAIARLAMACSEGGMES